MYLCQYPDIFFYAVFKILLKNKTLIYQIKKNKRGKNIRFGFEEDGILTVWIPVKIPMGSWMIKVGHRTIHFAGAVAQVLKELGRVSFDRSHGNTGQIGHQTDHVAFAR